VINLRGGGACGAGLCGGAAAAGDSIAAAGASGFASAAGAGFSSTTGAAAFAAMVSVIVSGAAFATSCGGAAAGFGVTTFAATGAGTSSFTAGLITLGATAAGATGAAFTGVAGFAAAGGGVGAFAMAGASGAAPAFFSRAMSPGLEIFEKSIFGLGSSFGGAAAALLPFAKKARTRTASSSSTELEWVFFSVTPTLGRTSRIALLFTSSSLARSLIRIFDIRPAFLPMKSAFPLSDHCVLMASS
jgi:hypothetical protein